MGLNSEESSKSPSFEIKNRRPRKISTMTRSDAERHSQEASKLHKKIRASVNLPKITKEEFEDDIPEMRSRSVNDVPTSSQNKKRRKSPGELIRMLNQDNPKPKKKIKKLKEGTMTPNQKKKEDRLKEKFDKSDMKQKMIDQYGKENGTNIYFAKIRKMAMEQLLVDEDYLEEKKISRTARKSARAGKPGYDSEGNPKPKGKVRAWDMDETLMRNDPKKIRVHVKDKSGKTVQSLTNQEFNTHKLDKDSGHSYDFSEFRSSEKFSKASTPNKSMVKKLKKQMRRGKPVHIVTARGSFDDQPKFAKHLRKHGIEIDKGKGKGGRYVHVHRAGDIEGGDIGEKKVRIVKGLMDKHGTSGAEMYDDAAKVHRAFKKSNNQTPSTRGVKTKMVQPNSRNVTQSRSFKEEIDIDLIYNVILEQLILVGFAESYDEASNLIDNMDDEILEYLIDESYDNIVQVLEEDFEFIDEEIENKSKIDYISPYKKLQEKKQIKERYSNVETQLTPYEYWKSFIGSDDEDFYEEVEENFNVEESISSEDFESMTSYQKWKLYLNEAGRESMIAGNIARASSSAAPPKPQQPTPQAAPKPIATTSSPTPATTASPTVASPVSRPAAANPFANKAELNQMRGNAAISSISKSPSAGRILSGTSRSPEANKIGRESLARSSAGITAKPNPTATTAPSPQAKPTSNVVSTSTKAKPNPTATTAPSPQAKPNPTDRVEPLWSMAGDKKSTKATNKPSGNVADRETPLW